MKLIYLIFKNKFQLISLQNRLKLKENSKNGRCWENIFSPWITKSQFIRTGPIPPVSREIKCNNFAEVDLLSSLWDTVLIATQETNELIQHSWHSFVNCSSYMKFSKLCSFLLQSFVKMGFHFVIIIPNWIFVETKINYVSDSKH